MTAKFVPPIRRIQTAKGHYYKDGQGHRIPGVTTILGSGVPKPALINWAANATAEAAVDRWDELTELAPSARLKTLQGARYEATDKAKKRGTEVHRYGERLVKGDEVTGIPDELRGHCEGYTDFLNAHDVEPVLVEATIVSYKYGYAGTLDLIAWITTPDDGRQLWLVDLKSNEKGIFPETALQLAGYRFAEFYIDTDGNEQPMLAVERTGAILISATSAQLIPTVSTEQQLRTFWYSGQLADFVNNGRDLVGPAIEAPTVKSTARIVWEESQQ